MINMRVTHIIATSFPDTVEDIAIGGTAYLPWASHDFDYTAPWLKLSAVPGVDTPSGSTMLVHLISGEVICVAGSTPARAVALQADPEDDNW